MTEQNKHFHVAFNCGTEGCGGNAIVSSWETMDEAKDQVKQQGGDSVWGTCNTCSKTRQYARIAGHHESYPFVHDSSGEEDPGFEIGRV